MSRIITFGSLGKLAVSKLYTDTIWSTPVNYDWNAHDYKREEYDIINIGEEEMDENYWDHVDNNFPMMNYYYPLPSTSWDSYDEQDAKALVDSNLCLVNITETDQYALALTGGGMNFTWEICEAFIRIGYLPPLHFCDLPKMAGRGKTASDRKIISACKRSIGVARFQLKRKHRDLMNVKKWSEKR